MNAISERKCHNYRLPLRPEERNFEKSNKNTKQEQQQITQIFPGVSFCLKGWWSAAT